MKPYTVKLRVVSGSEMGCDYKEETVTLSFLYFDDAVEFCNSCLESHETKEVELWKDDILVNSWEQ